MTPDDKKRLEGIREVIRVINPRIENNDAAFLLTQLDEAHAALREIRLQRMDWFDAWETVATDTVNGTNERGRKIIDEQDEVFRKALGEE